mmetsp:Transcript_14689/g.25645  ORF Transcript_14689/g.25645 Transcript_14689/m.25645 type:complete len:82 (+) Transcript_14689:1341-1586(+)
MGRDTKKGLYNNLSFSLKTSFRTKKRSGQSQDLLFPEEVSMQVPNALPNSYCDGRPECGWYAVIEQSISTTTRQQLTKYYS